MPLEFTLSSKGRSILVYEGYEFWLKKVLNRNMNWRCSKYQTHKCPVTLVTAQDDVINQSSTHNHECNRDKAIAKNAVEKIKEKMLETTTTLGACQANVIVNLPPSVLIALPRKSVISRTLRQHRERLRNKDIGRALPSLLADTNFEVPTVYKEFLLYDSLEKSENNRFLVFCDRQLLEWL
ncbi:hypothetical protein BgiMline_022196 [Biomphalaria glabrata]|nr:hypothetical protein BgiMline_010079 [Biomphalaria glabrata]